jgi:ribonucleoside-diphosphate reductase alpha chain
LNTWLVYQRSWCEHKPSITVSVKEDEWMEVGAWVYKHFDEVSGISFLPHSDHSYKQAPYQEVTKEEYETLLSQMPKNIRWADLSFYETEDGTSGTQTLACTSDGNCEIVDISA